MPLGLNGQTQAAQLHLTDTSHASGGLELTMRGGEMGYAWAREDHDEVNLPVSEEAVCVCVEGGVHWMGAKL